MEAVEEHLSQSLNSLNGVFRVQGLGFRVIWGLGFMVGWFRDFGLNSLNGVIWVLVYIGLL